jgi:hypothetical protein
MGMGCLCKKEAGKIIILVKYPYTEHVLIIVENMNYNLCVINIKMYTRNGFVQFTIINIFSEWMGDTIILSIQVKKKNLFTHY